MCENTSDGRLGRTAAFRLLQPSNERQRTKQPQRSVDGRATNESAQNSFVPVPLSCRLAHHEQPRALGLPVHPQWLGKGIGARELGQGTGNYQYLSVGRMRLRDRKGLGSVFNRRLFARMVELADTLL